VAPAAAGTLQGSKIIDQSPPAALRRWLVAEPAYDDRAVNLAALPPATVARASRIVGAVLLLAYVVFWLFPPGRAAPSALLIDLSVGCCAMVQIVGFNLKAQFVVLLLPALAATWGALATRRPGERILLALAGLAFLACQPGLVGRAASNLLLAHSAMA